jgi:hypothetical protein
MGCSSSNTEELLSSPDLALTSIIRKRFTSDQVSIISTFNKFEPDKPFFKVKTVEYNALGLSILVSDLKLMKTLHRNFSASFSFLDDLMRNQNKQLIQVFIKHFNEGVMEYYLPIFLESETKNRFNEVERSLDFSGFSLNPCKRIHPLRYAVKHDSLPFIKFIVSQFRQCQPPECFNIHSIDEETGENCALLSCRFGSLPLVEYLHKQNCNFHISNKYGETALNLSLVPRSKGKPRVSVLPFLVEVVGLDITKNYEETLILCKNSAMTEYIEEKLRQKGIFDTKQNVEAKYARDSSSIALDSQSPVKLSSFENIFESKELSLTFS